MTTVIPVLADFPPDSAKISAAPVPLAVTSPAATVATASLDERHETGRRDWPPLGVRAVADSAYVSPTVSEVGIEETSIAAMVVDGSIGLLPPSLEHAEIQVTARAKQMLRENPHNARIRSSKTKSSS